MTPYEELKKKICEALPRLMDDVVGQTYERNGDYSRAIMATFNGMSLLCFQNEVNFYYYSELKNRFIPLGIEPTLSDCLEYVNKSNYVDGVNMMRDTEWLNHIIKLVQNWNLSQPLLKDQSKELIDYLLRL